MTFAIFGGTEFSSQDEISAEIEHVLRRPIDPVSGRRVPSLAVQYWPTAVVAAVDGHLPLAMGGLIANAGELSPQLKSSKYVAFIRYAGPRLAREDHLRQSAWLVSTLANRPEHVVVDLSTRRIFSSEQWRFDLKKDDWIQDQVTLGAEKNAANKVTFYSRGMAKFAMPDLEMMEIPSSQARRKFEVFLSALRLMRTKTAVKVGDRIGPHWFTACRRSPEAIEKACVALQ